jgi:UDPglucose 6-dehydrogenase
MQITIIGAGYVGLVAGACYASTGNDVIMVDQDKDRVEMLRRGEVPIYEPALAELIADAAQTNRITFTTDLPSACSNAEIIGIAVGTPPQPDGSVDMSFVNAVAKAIGENIKGYCVIVTKSTVPVGTHQRITQIIGEGTEIEFDYVSNPEFLKEGTAVSDFLSPERVIIGTMGERARKIMGHLYAPFMRQGRRILFMSPASAELTKYACNAMLATRISFMNELARLAETVDADVNQIRMGMGSDSRIGRSFLFPGLGYGGSCFPKDVKALVHTGAQHGVEMGIAAAAELTNKTQPEMLIEKIEKYFGGQLEGKKFALWGLAFKPNTDDMREAPSLKIIEHLLARGASVAGHDPKAQTTAKVVLGDSITYHEDAFETFDGADGLIICTEWMEFRTPSFQRIAELLRHRVIFDGRNLYDPEYVNEAGIDYLCIGRPDAIVNE